MIINITKGCRGLSFLREKLKFLFLLVFRESGDKVAEASASSGLGRVHLRRSDFDAALRHHHLSLRLSSEQGDARGRAVALANLGETHEAAEDNARARESFEELLRVAEEEVTEDTELRVRAYENLGKMHCTKYFDNLLV